MSRVPLSDEDRRVVLVGEAGENLRELDAGQQEQVLWRLLDIVEADATPSAFVREEIGNLHIIAAGDQPRLYTKIVENIPRGNAIHHVVYVLYIDIGHDYPPATVRQYSGRAEKLLEATTTLDSVEDVEEHLTDLGGLDADALRRLLP